MSLKLLCGRGGTGKTERLFTAFAESKAEKRILLVPESFSSEAERLAVVRLGGLGPNGAEVYSFRRMARAVREQFGDFGWKYLSATDRVLLMSAVIDRNVDRLQLLQKAAASPSFVTMVLDLISEWKRYGITPEQLTAFCDTAGESVLRLKLSDFALLYAAYEEWIADRYTDPEDDLALLLEQLPHTHLFDGAEWFLDGFYEFTKTELQILGLLMQSGRRMTVSLLCDRAQSEGAAPFAAVRRTAEKLLLTAADRGVEAEDTTVLVDRHRFVKAPDLAYVEALLAEAEAPAPDTSEHITITACPGVYEELHAAAREVLRLCREEGYRFREMALLARDLTPYKPLLSQVFRSYGIPVFLDNKVSALSHATVRFCLLALDAVAGGYAPEVMFDYIKTDLLPVPFETLCELENKVLREGLRGKDWKTPWEDALEPVRQSIITPLETFREKVAYGVPGREMAAAFYTLLTDLNVPETLRKKEGELLRAGALKEREITRQVWHLLCGLLDRTAEWLADDRLTAARFAQILKLTFTNLELGSIPPMQDALLISDTARVRSGRIRAVLLLGANEGECPKTAFPDGIITDRERQTLLDAGLEMAPAGSARLELETLYLYSALTRAEERLSVFYHLYAGGSALPAYWIQTLRERLLGLSVQADAPALSAPHPTLRLLTQTLSRGEALPAPIAEAAAWFLSQDEYQSRTRRLLWRAGFKNLPATLSAEALAGIRPRLERQSVSGIEQYYSCPYLYYLQRMLGAKERKVLQFLEPEIGTMVHTALERFAARAAGQPPENSKGVVRLALTVLNELRAEQAAFLARSPKFGFMFAQAKKIVLRSALAMWEQSERSAFVQTRQEVGFGYDGGYPPITVPLRDGTSMKFRGIIDRVDRFGDYLRVIDYKTGSKVFSTAALEQGLQLQLLLYLKAASIGEGATPAGAFYFHAKNELYRADGPIDPVTAAAKRRLPYHLDGVVMNDSAVVEAMDRAFAEPDGCLPVKLTKNGIGGKGAVSADELNALCDLAEERLFSACQEIADGSIPMTPCSHGGTVPCSYCKMSAVCGFDLTLGNRYRSAKEVSDDAMDE